MYAGCMQCLHHLNYYWIFLKFSVNLNLHVTGLPPCDWYVNLFEQFSFNYAIVCLLLLKVDSIAQSSVFWNVISNCEFVSSKLEPFWGHLVFGYVNTIGIIMKSFELESVYIGMLFPRHDLLLPSFLSTIVNLCT